MVYFRHLEDYRIFDQLFPFLDCPEKTQRIAALRATSTFRNPAKWPPVMDALSDPGSTQPLLSAALQHVGEPIPLSIKRKLQPILAGLLDRRLNARVQEQVSWAICTTIEERTVDAMIELLADSRGARKTLGKTVKMSTSGDRMQFLERRFISQLP
ncbi:hypothetical protein RE6C_01471 [Rhodopirellula europaea 6C]|uniref:Uncharacterized protein n=1 Tax=Rhodopirellula europaea 6C TaxID=1263867 RepID=M2AL41_9BACT|nr:hypothetical protein RE6C_01471 [Rhodopirellula europaea 6C]